MAKSIDYIDKSSRRQQFDIKASRKGMVGGGWELMLQIQRLIMWMR